MRAYRVVTTSGFTMVVRAKSPLDAYGIGRRVLGEVSYVELTTVEAS